MLLSRSDLRSVERFSPGNPFSYLLPLPFPPPEHHDRHHRRRRCGRSERILRPLPRMRRLIHGVCLLLFSTSLFAEDFCSLVVKVRDPQGAEVEASVVVEERDGRKIEKENTPGGVKFCDLGITPVTVTVGSPSCNQVIVRNVPLDWGETSLVSVVYDDRPCLVDAPPVAACKFLFRFIDAQHNSINGVVLRTHTPYEETHKADTFGRLLIRIAAWQKLSGTASADGYEPAELRVPCITKNQRIEQYVTLVPRTR